MAEIEYVLAGYREIAQHFRLGSADAARVKAKRAGWPEEPRNHPRDTATYRVPREVWDAVETLPPISKELIPPSSESVLPQSGRTRSVGSKPYRQRGALDIDLLRSRSARLEGELAGVRQALAEAQARADAEGRRADCELAGVRLALGEAQSRAEAEAARAVGAEARAVAAEVGIRDLQERLVRLESDLAAARAPLLERLGRGLRGFLDALKGK